MSDRLLRIAKHFNHIIKQSKVVKMDRELTQKILDTTYEKIIHWVENKLKVKKQYVDSTLTQFSPISVYLNKKNDRMIQFLIDHDSSILAKELGILVEVVDDPNHRLASAQSSHHTEYINFDWIGIYLKDNINLNHIKSKTFYSELKGLIYHEVTHLFDYNYKSQTDHSLASSSYEEYINQLREIKAFTAEILERLISYYYDSGGFDDVGLNIQNAVSEDARWKYINEKNKKMILRDLTQAIDEMDLV